MSRRTEACTCHWQRRLSPNIELAPFVFRSSSRSAEYETTTLSLEPSRYVTTKGCENSSMIVLPANTVDERIRSESGLASLRMHLRNQYEAFNFTAAP